MRMATEKPGPFDPILKQPAEPAERDRAVVYVVGTIIGLALLLLILVLPPISVLSRGGGGSSASGETAANSDSYGSTVRSGMPKLPAGLVAASALFDLSAPADKRGASHLTVTLKEKQSDQHALGLYTYVDSKWQRLSDVTLVASGAAARGDVSSLPGNVAVLKRSRASLQVAGSIPAGTTLDKRAEPSLTVLHPLVFIPSDTGDLAGTPPAVPPASYKVVPSIVGIYPDVVNTILRSSELRATHASNIADKVRTSNYAGINVDYRSVNSDLKDQFTDFVTQLQQALHADGRTLTLTLPMPQAQGGNINAGAYDWQKLGGLADTIELVGDLDQEVYFQNTEAALQYIADKVDRSKLLLVISPLSIERGGDGLRAMSQNDALTIASQVTAKLSGDIAPSAPVQLVAQNLAQSEAASGIHWDEAARSVTFSYPGRGGKRTVWLANQFSAAFRLDLAQRYGLSGVSVTDVSTEGGGADIYPAIRELADSGSITLTRPNGDLFTPAWTSSDGSLSAPSGDTVTWTAPATPGVYSATMIVSDGVIRAGQVVQLTVVAPPPTPAAQ